MEQQLEQLSTDQLRQKAERAGVGDTARMNKDELIGALGGATNLRRGGGQRQKDPRPPGVSPEDYKYLPGNQT